MGFLSNTMASYSIPVRQVSALLSASFRPLVTETPLPSRYFLPHRRVETVDFHHQQCALSGAPLKNLYNNFIVIEAVLCFWGPVQLS